MTAFVPSASEIGQRLDLTSESDLAALGAIVNSEIAAQARACNIGDWMPDDLREALIRRVSRALAMRNLPLGVLADDSGATRLGSFDPEIRRLEAPYRKTPIG